MPKSVLKMSTETATALAKLSMITSRTSCWILRLQRCEGPSQSDNIDKSVTIFSNFFRYSSYKYFVKFGQKIYVLLRTAIKTWPTFRLTSNRLQLPNRFSLQRFGGDGWKNFSWHKLLAFRSSHIQRRDYCYEARVGTSDRKAINWPK